MKNTEERLPPPSLERMDNRLEFIAFYPFRFMCFFISFGSLFLVYAAGWHGLLIGGTLCLLFFALATVQKRITLDFTGMQYREYIWLLGIKWGTWQHLNNFHIITITHSNRMNRLNSRYGARSIQTPSRLFYLNLKEDNFTKITIAAGNHSSLLKKAFVLSQRFQLDVLDCKETPNKKIAYHPISKTDADALL